MYNYRRVHPNDSKCRALQVIFKGGMEEILFTRISLLRHNEDAMMEIEIADEYSVEAHGTCPRGVTSSAVQSNGTQADSRWETQFGSLHRPNYSHIDSYNSLINIVR